MALLQWYKITEDYVILKFGISLDTSTFVNDNFTLSNTDATPSEAVANPFDAIVVDRDYQSVSRELYLYWNTTLEPNTQYTLTLANLEDIFGNAQSDYNIIFETPGELATPNISESDFTKEPTQIDDYSIKIIGELNTISGSESTDTFQIISVDPPATESYYMTAYTNQGKIEITFSHVIPSNFVNNSDFKLQKKPIGTNGIAVWETVSTIVAQSGDESGIVSIYLPSTDATPIYSYEVADPSEYVFWEESYKYKLTISKSVGY